MQTSQAFMAQTTLVNTYLISICHLMYLIALASQSSSYTRGPKSERPTFIASNATPEKPLTNISSLCIITLHNQPDYLYTL